MRPSVLTHARWCCVIALGVIAVTWLAAGCTGSATARFVSLNPTAIDPPPAKVWPYDAQECYWWLDEAGDLNIALKCRRQHLLLGKYGRVDLDIAFTLGKPPAGSGRNYPVRRREIRTRFTSALHDMRLNSQAGIVAVMVQDDGTLRGSFRIWMTPRMELQLFSLFPQKPGRFLCFGEFHAVRNEERGKAIRAHCTFSSGSRPPREKQPTTSQPATTQPANDQA